jgi:hypothetical protein
MTDRTRTQDTRLSEPVAWLHTMYMEFGQSQVVVTMSPQSAFGRPGEDHSKCYPVTSEPLYRKTIIKRPRVSIK